MSTKLSTTPRSKVKIALRQLFMRSRERAAALKRENYCCERCGVKKSEAKGREVKIEVHHKKGIKWDEIVEFVFERILCDPSDLEVICKECHDKEHGRIK